MTTVMLPGPEYGRPGFWGGHMDGWGDGWMWFSGLLAIVAVTLLIAVVVLLARGGSRTSGPRSGRGFRAREILDERYAAGELSTDEYRERVRELSEPGGSAP